MQFFSFQSFLQLIEVFDLCLVKHVEDFNRKLTRWVRQSIRLTWFRCNLAMLFTVDSVNRDRSNSIFHLLGSRIYHFLFMTNVHIF